MINVCIRGGLGNQIFKYVFGRVLSVKFYKEIILDSTPLLGKRVEKYRKNYPGTYFTLNEYAITAGYLLRVIARIYFLSEERKYIKYNIIYIHNS